MHGWILLDKPLGLGSTQGVSAVKRALREGGYAKVKVGHGGTLDPLATGVLPIALGEATKLAGRMLDSDKVYDFTIRFGVETDTLDAEGKVIAESDVRPTLAQLEAVLPRFTGPIEQVPPAYSALKVDGERAYDLARAGETVVLKSRAVRIYGLEVVAAPEIGHPHPSAASPLPPSPDGRGKGPAAGGGGKGEGDEYLQQITLRAHVSKGTYIRSLARDIARALGTVGHVTYLRRIKAGPFTLDQAISLDSLADAAKERRLEDICLPLRAGLDDIPALPLTPDQAGLLRQGRVLVGIAKDDGLYFALLGDTPVALVEAEAGSIRVVRGFNL
jgi:tRNA pseudouridine55 synthase